MVAEGLKTSQASLKKEVLGVGAAQEKSIPRSSGVVSLGGFHQAMASVPVCKRIFCSFSRSSIRNVSDKQPHRRG